MTTVQEQLLSLLSSVLFGTQTTVTVTPEIMEEAKAQAVSTLICADYSILASNIRVINAHAELTKLLTGIPFTTFKGYASAFYYPDPAMRPMGDVDFTADPACHREVVERLEAAGWRKVNAVHARHESFQKGKVDAELHSEIKGIPNGADGIATASATAATAVRELLSDLIATARTVETQHGPVIIPDDFHHGVIMLLHVAGHLINDGGVGLRHLYDWAVYVSRADIESCREQLERVGLWTFACQLTAVSSRYLGLRKMDWAGEWPEEFLAAFLEDILKAGNFGRKESGRRTVLALEKGSFAALTRERYPQASRPLLLPFFMLINLIRYGLLLVKGERRVIKPSTFAGAKDRDKLYKQFKLFEV